MGTVISYRNGTLVAQVVYVNALDQDDEDRIPQAYGPNYKRLCEVKQKYDPENLFRRNQNIRPRPEPAVVG